MSGEVQLLQSCRYDVVYYSADFIRSYSWVKSLQDLAPRIIDIIARCDFSFS